MTHGDHSSGTLTNMAGTVHPCLLCVMLMVLFYSFFAVLATWTILVCDAQLSSAYFPLIFLFIICNIVVGVMKTGIEPTFLAFQASVLPP